MTQENFKGCVNTSHLCQDVDTPVFLVNTFSREWPWWMQTISIISGSLVNILIFVAWSWWRADKPSLPVCLQNNQYHRRKWKALKLCFLNGYSQETQECDHPRKVILGVWILYLAMMNGSGRGINRVPEMRVIRSQLRMTKIKMFP